MEGLAKTIYKELQQINRKSIFDDTAVVEPLSEDNPLVLRVTLTPQDGFYAGGTFLFTLTVPENYPQRPPRVVCNTKIYHPNIGYPAGNICFNMLTENNPSYRLEHYVNGLLFLLHNPCLESRLNSRVTGNLSDFAKNVALSLVGGKVGGMSFAPLKELTKEEQLLDSLRRHGAAALVAFFRSGEDSFTSAQLRGLLADSPSLGPELARVSPLLARAASQEGPPVAFCRVPRGAHSVPKRSAHLGAAPDAVVKEMIIMVAERPAMLLATGNARLCEQELSALFGAPIRVPKAKEIGHLGSFGSLSPFSFAHEVYATRGLMDSQVLFCGAGIRHILLKATPQDLLQLCPQLQLLGASSATRSPSSASAPAPTLAAAPASASTTAPAAPSSEPALPQEPFSILNEIPLQTLSIST